MLGVMILPCIPWLNSPPLHFSPVIPALTGTLLLQVGLKVKELQAPPLLPHTEYMSLACPDQTAAQVGLKVKELQAQLPKARVVYCSATGASGENC